MSAGSRVCFYGAVGGPPQPDSVGDVARPSFRTCVREDFAGSTVRQRVLLVATVGWVAYEWGLGNETLTRWILVRVISDTSGWWSVLATAGVGFAFTTAQQLASGATAVIGFSMFERTSAAAWRLLRSRLADEPRDWSRLSLVTRALVVFTLGTTAVVLIQTTVTGDARPERHRRTVVQAATMVGLLVAGIGAIVASAVWLGRSVPTVEPATEWLLRVLGNPLFWIGLLAAVLGFKSVRSRATATTA